MLRDAQLPEVLLPFGWSGQSARIRCKELYRCLLVPCQGYVDRFQTTAEGRCPARQPAFHDRFTEEDHPLLPMAP